MIVNHSKSKTPKASIERSHSCQHVLYMGVQVYEVCNNNTNPKENRASRCKGARDYAASYWSHKVLSCNMHSAYCEAATYSLALSCTCCRDASVPNSVSYCRYLLKKNCTAARHNRDENREPHPLPLHLATGNALVEKLLTAEGAELNPNLGKIVKSALRINN